MKVNYLTNSIATIVVLFAVVVMGVVGLVAIILHEPPETMTGPRMSTTRSHNREHSVNVRSLPPKSAGTEATSPAYTPNASRASSNSDASRPVRRFNEQQFRDDLIRRQQPQAQEPEGQQSAEETDKHSILLSEATRMIKDGEDLNTPSKYGYLLLHWATSEGDLDVAKLLIENGADVNAHNVDGFTPLMLATQEGETDIAKFLIENGADVNVKDENGETALNMAKERNLPAIVQLLREHGAKDE